MNCQQALKPSHPAPPYGAPNQPSQIAHLYTLAGRICQVSPVQYIIEIGGSFGQTLTPHLKGAIFLGVLPLGSPQDKNPTTPLSRIVEVDFHSFLQLDEEILNDAMIIWPRMDQDLLFWPSLAGRMRDWLSKCAFAVLSHSRLLNAHHRHAAGSGSMSDELQASDNFKRLLAQVGASSFLVGKSAPPSLGSVPHGLALGGRCAVYQAKPKKRVLAIVSCFNDRDIVSDVVEHLIAEGVQMHFIDNWSTDGTWEYLCRKAREMPEWVVAIERYPVDAQDKHYDWNGILMRKEDIAHASPFDWFIHYDSDELRTSCWPNVSLVDAISFIDSLGYNAINHHVIDFRPTQDGFTADKGAKSFFTHFERNNVRANRLQVKAWKKQANIIELSPSGGHIAWFPNQKVFPLCFLLAHYSLRSSQQAKSKIYKDRLPRVGKEHAERNYHGHYNKYREQAWVDHGFIWDTAQLLKYDSQAFHEDYFIERLTGE